MLSRLTRTALIISSKRHVSIDLKALPEHRALMVEKFGEPEDSVVLRTRKPEEVLPKELESGQILVEHLAACVNPADINLIQGVYGIKPPLPAVIGNEGIGRVKQVGDNIRHLKPGDLTMAVSNIGSWQSYSVQAGDSLYKVDNDLELTTAAQLKVNPCTAYRMIKDYHQVRRGDVIIQNGANSAVGVYVVQFAKQWGIKTINVIRDRPNRIEIEKELKDYGADYVVTEEAIRDRELMQSILSDIGKPKLFLNCVSGKNAVSCQRYLDHGGASVTYGFMSKQPLTIGSRAMFEDHKIHFFWMSRWYHEREASKRGEIIDMLDEISNMFKLGLIRPKRSTLLSFEERHVAFSGSNNTKYIFSINK